MEELVKDIVNELTIELQTDPRFNAEILQVKVRNAVREVKMRRNYGATTYSEERIIDDLYNYYTTIVNVARYDYNQIGAEGEQLHTESSVSRSWVDREQLFYGVHAFVNVLG